MDWVCDDAWKGPFSQSMFSFGSLFGTIALGYVADSFGRLTAWYTANILLMITGLATPFMTEFVGFTCMRFLQGISFDSFFSVFYVLGNFTSGYFDGTMCFGKIEHLVPGIGGNKCS